MSPIIPITPIPGVFGLRVSDSHLPATYPLQMPKGAAQASKHKESRSRLTEESAAYTTPKAAEATPAPLSAFFILTSAFTCRPSRCDIGGG